jgi:hypothetical protein
MRVPYLRKQMEVGVFEGPDKVARWINASSNAQRSFASKILSCIAISRLYFTTECFLSSVPAFNKCAIAASDERVSQII